MFCTAICLLLINDNFAHMLYKFDVFVTDAFPKLENIGLNKTKVSEMGKYFDILHIIWYTEKKEECRYG